MCCDGYIESLVCLVDRSQSRLICVQPLWPGRLICSGSGSPARTHDHLYIPIKNTPTITCSAIFPSLSICDQYGQYYLWSHICATRGEYSRYRSTSQGSPYFFLMDRIWGLWPGLYQYDNLLQSEGLLYPLDCALGHSCDERCMPDWLTRSETSYDCLVLYC